MATPPSPLEQRYPGAFQSAVDAGDLTAADEKGMQRYPALVTTLTRLGIGIFGRTQKALCRSLLAELSMIYALKGDPDRCDTIFSSLNNGE